MDRLQGLREQLSNLVVGCLKLRESRQVGQVLELGHKVVVELEGLEEDELGTLEPTEVLDLVLAKIQVLEALVKVGSAQFLPQCVLTGRALRPLLAFFC